MGKINFELKCATFIFLLIAPAYLAAEKWSYTDESGYKCISIGFTARLNSVPLTKNVRISASYAIPLNNSKIISGSCGEHVQKVSIEWNDKWHGNLMNLSFSSDEDQKKYSLNEISITMSEGLLPGGNDSTYIHLFYRGHNLETPINTSYYSDKDQILPLTNEYLHRMGSLELSNIWFEAHNKIPLCKLNHTDIYGNHKDTIIVLSSFGCTALVCVIIGFVVCYCKSRPRIYDSGYVRI